MSDNELLKPLHDALALAQELVRLAQAEAWEEMDVTTSLYQQKLSVLGDNVFMQAIKGADAVSEAKAIIERIQAINVDLDSHTLLQREKIASELRQLTQSGKALEAYGR